MKYSNLIIKTVNRILNVIIAISLAWFIVHSFFTQTRVVGHSMESTLSASDIVLIDNLTYNFIKPSRMDPVVYDRDGSDNIKRIVALPGETIYISDGNVYINGVKLESDKIKELSLAGVAAKPVTLLDDEYFLIGDNADSSEDSRFANVGNIKDFQIKGKVWFRIYPFDKIGFVK